MLFSSFFFSSFFFVFLCKNCLSSSAVPAPSSEICPSLLGSQRSAPRRPRWCFSGLRVGTFFDQHHQLASFFGNYLDVTSSRQPRRHQCASACRFGFICTATRAWHLPACCHDVAMCLLLQNLWTLFAQPTHAYDAHVVVVVVVTCLLLLMFVGGLWDLLHHRSFQSVQSKPAEQLTTDVQQLVNELAHVDLQSKCTTTIWLQPLPVVDTLLNSPEKQEFMTEAKVCVLLLVSGCLSKCGRAVFALSFVPVLMLCHHPRFSLLFWSWSPGRPFSRVSP